MAVPRLGPVAASRLDSITTATTPPKIRFRVKPFERLASAGLTVSRPTAAPLVLRTAATPYASRISPYGNSS